METFVLIEMIEQIQYNRQQKLKVQYSSRHNNYLVHHIERFV